MTLIEQFFLWPGDAACNALGVDKSSDRDLVRMLINSLIWAVVGVMIVAFSV